MTRDFWIGLAVVAVAIPISWRLFVAVARRFGTDDTPMGTVRPLYQHSREREDEQRRERSEFWRQVDEREQRRPPKVRSIR